MSGSRRAVGESRQSKTAILDFGSQYTQVIARRVRECRVHAKGAPRVDPEIYRLGVPILGVCYGLQLLARDLGGAVAPSKQRERHLQQTSRHDRVGVIDRSGISRPRSASAAARF